MEEKERGRQGDKTRKKGRERERRKRGMCRNRQTDKAKISYLLNGREREREERKNVCPSLP